MSQIASFDYITKSFSYILLYMLSYIYWTYYPTFNDS